MFGIWGPAHWKWFIIILSCLCSLRGFWFRTELSVLSPSLLDVEISLKCPVSSGWKTSSELGLHLAVPLPSRILQVFPGLSPAAIWHLCLQTPITPSSFFTACHSSCVRLFGISASAWNCIRFGLGLQSLIPVWLLILPLFGILPGILYLPPHFCSLCPLWVVLCYSEFCLETI